MTPRAIPLPDGRPSFLGAPRCPDVGRLDADLAVIGVPYTTAHDLAQSRAPSSAAPAALREQSLRFADQIDHHDFDLGGDLFAGRAVRLADCGDVWAAPGQYEANARHATAVLEAILARGAVPIVLGGDQAATIPVLRAYGPAGPVGVIHLGVDLAWRDEVGGVREGLASAMRRAAELPWVTAMMQVGLRGAGSARRGDVADARAFGSVLVRAEELHEQGVARILRRLPAAPAYYVSLDLSALDPAIAPGVENPAFGGLTYFEATNLLKGIAARAPVVGLDVVGVSPARDLHDRTSLLGARLILNLAGALAHAGRIGTTGQERATGAGPRPARPAARSLEPVGVRP